MSDTARNTTIDTQAFMSQQALTESWARLASRFRELHRLSLAEFDSADAQYADYLQSGCRLLDMDTGIISRIRDGTYTILAAEPGSDALYAGQQFELGDTYCAWVIEKQEAVAVDDIGADAAKSEHPVYRNMGLASYIAAPIWVDGKIFGTLNFTRAERRNGDFGPEDWEFVELMANALGRDVERNLLENLRETTTQRMRENIDLFESAFRYAPAGIALVAPDGRWLRVNGAVSEILGYPENELLTLDFQAITHPDDLEADLNLVHEMLAGERDTYRMEKRYYHADGHVVWVLLSVSMVRREDGSPRYFVSQLLDITERKQVMEELQQKRSQLELANRRLRQLATRDALTQVLNRHAFDERFAAELRRATRSRQPVSLLLLDVDHFKRYNDDYGHPAGDQALREVARVLTVEARIDDCVARYGGEEFAVILPDTDSAGCRMVAERMRAAVAAIDSLENSMTASIGTATFYAAPCGLSPDTAAELVALADEALYKAKAGGRNQCQHAARSPTKPPASR